MTHEFFELLTMANDGQLIRPTTEKQKMKTNVFDMTPEERECAMEMLHEEQVRYAVRFFRKCFQSSPRTYRGIPVSPSTQLGQLWFCGLYVGKRLVIYLGNKTTCRPTETIVGTSDDWLSLLQTLADFHCTPILKTTEAQ